MRLAWGQFMVWVEDNLEASTMIRELSAFWMSYIHIIDNVVLGLLLASHEENWSLHLNATECMLPWHFAYNKVDYARYHSLYFVQMTDLPEKKRDV